MTEWDYEAFVGNFSFEGGVFYIWAQNQWFPLKEMLNAYGRTGYELISTDYDHTENRLVYIFKKPLNAAPPPRAAAPAAAPADPGPADDDGGGNRRRRSAKDLEKLLREMG